MLDGNNGGYANDWLLGDSKTGEIAQLELGLKAYRGEADERRRVCRNELVERNSKVIKADAPQI